MRHISAESCENWVVLCNPAKKQTSRRRWQWWHLVGGDKLWKWKMKIISVPLTLLKSIAVLQICNMNSRDRAAETCRCTKRHVSGAIVWSKLPRARWLLSYQAAWTGVSSFELRFAVQTEVSGAAVVCVCVIDSERRAVDPSGSVRRCSAWSGFHECPASRHRWAM